MPNHPHIATNAPAATITTNDQFKYVTADVPIFEYPEVFAVIGAVTDGNHLVRQAVIV